MRFILGSMQVKQKPLRIFFMRDICLLSKYIFKAYRKCGQWWCWGVGSCTLAVQLSGPGSGKLYNATIANACRGLGVAVTKNPNRGQLLAR